MKRHRIEQLTELIDKRGKLSMAQLTEYFPEYSEMTLRRDLKELEETGKVVRVRGGVRSVLELQQTTDVPNYTKKTAQNSDEKMQIACKAAVLIDDGASMFLDGGSTALFLAKELPDVKYNVFTNGIMVATELARKKNVSVNLLGGELQHDNLSTFSPLAEMYFADMNFQIAVISATAFTIENGFSCGTQAQADLLKLVRKKAKFVYMLLDSSKIGKVMPYTFARLKDINVLVTDENFPQSLKEKFKEQNVVVL